ncbi:hypothetical protein TWF718_001876 [Orbilia javanica]|uniref:Uncharacterized protein n=1 Tax=Orbilia javanica TaxID=47235 RepID=A0AAN8RNR2_9PEZI
MVLDTGIASGCITQTSVGPISKMLHRWLESQELSGWPFHLPTDQPFESTSDLDTLLSKLPSSPPPSVDFKSEDFLDPMQTPKLLLDHARHEYWNTLWKMAIITRCICNQLFSLGNPEDINLSYTRMPTKEHRPYFKPTYGPTAQIYIKPPRFEDNLIPPLLRELSDAIARNWLNKGYILLNAGRIASGAQLVLRHIYHLSCFTIDQCHRYRNDVLLGLWKQFMANIAAGESRSLVPPPFSTISEFFGVFLAFENPHEPPRYFPNSHPDVQYLITTNFSDPHESKKYQLLKSEDEQILQKHLTSRQTAIRNKQWETAIAITDHVLSSTYPGVEETKRWLAVKAYLSAITKDWNTSITIQELLQHEPLNTNDRLRLEVYFTNAITALSHQKNLDAARKFCSAAVQLPEFVIPENERICDRKNADILYAVLYPDAEGIVENKEDHIRRLQKALSAWGQGGHLFEPGAPFHSIMGTPVQHLL